MADDNTAVVFCKQCGRWLKKAYNKQYDGTLEDFCNNRCRVAYRRKLRPRSNRSKGGFKWGYS